MITESKKQVILLHLVFFMGGGGIPECECDYGENKANSVGALSAILGVFISSDKHLWNDFHAIYFAHSCQAYIQIY